MMTLAKAPSTAVSIAFTAPVATTTSTASIAITTIIVAVTTYDAVSITATNI